MTLRVNSLSISTFLGGLPLVISNVEDKQNEYFRADSKA